MSFLDKREIILFQGDSVTDCGRIRHDINNLGNGYPLLVSSALSAVKGNDFTFINKGISGNKTCDLEKRWDEDCISLKPTVVSILIGINDTWRRFDSNDYTSTEMFEKHYRNILTRTTNELKVKLIMLEPFLLPNREDYDKWREDLDPKIQVARKLAMEFKAVYIPLDGLFAAAYAEKAPEFWAGDGVHPSIAGHGLIAGAWVDAVGLKQ